MHEYDVQSIFCQFIILNCILLYSTFLQSQFPFTKLIIILFGLKPLHPLNIDFNTLVASATQYVAFESHRYISEVLSILSLQDCLKEWELLKMKLQLVKNDPDSAHLIFSTPGVMASTRGEIIVLEKCVDVSSK